MTIRKIVGVIFLLPLLFAGCGGEKSKVCSINWSEQPGWDLDTIAIAQEVAVSGVWGGSQNEVYAVGMVDSGQGPIGMVWRYNGTNWSEFYARPNADFRDIHGVSSNSIWIAGMDDPEVFPGKALVLYWDGSVWQESLVEPTIGGLLATWAADNNHVFAVDRSRGAILRYDGTSWDEEDTPAKEDPPYTLFDHADIWGTEEQGKLVVYAGLAMTQNVIGTVLRRDSLGWKIDFQAPDLGYGSVFRGIWADGPDGVFALEQTGRGQAPVAYVYHRGDSGWVEAVPKFYAAELVQAIRGNYSGDLLVLGPRIYYLTTTAWEKYQDYPGAGWVSLRDLWIEGERAYIVGTAGSSTVGVVLHAEFGQTCSR